MSLIAHKTWRREAERGMLVSLCPGGIPQESQNASASSFTPGPLLFLQPGGTWAVSAPRISAGYFLTSPSWQSGGNL